MLTPAIGLVTCKKCGKEFKSDAALKDHLRDARVHRDSFYERKHPYRKWGLALFVLLVVCGVALLAYRGIQPGPSQTVLTGRSVSNTNSNFVFFNQTIKLTSNETWINATLNPLYKTHYNASGSINVVTCPYVLAESACPDMGLLVMNATGFANFQKNGALVSPYGAVAITPTVGQSTSFTLRNLDYDGVYYFVIIVTSQENALIEGSYVILALYLTETWS